MVAGKLRRHDARRSRQEGPLGPLSTRAGAPDQFAIDDLQRNARLREFFFELVPARALRRRTIRRVTNDRTAAVLSAQSCEGEVVSVAEQDQVYARSCKPRLQRLLGCCFEREAIAGSVGLPRSSGFIRTATQPSWASLEARCNARLSSILKSSASQRSARAMGAVQSISSSSSLFSFSNCLKSATT